MYYFKSIIVWIIVWALLTIAFVYQDKALAYEAVDESLVRESLYTLAETSDFLPMLHECKIGRSYWHWSDGLYLAITQDCDGVSKTIIVGRIEWIP